MPIPLLLSALLVKVSPVSSRKLYQEGQATIPSDTACFPAKLSHGHIAEPVRWAWTLCSTPHELQCGRTPGDNHYNCPVVACYYPEVLSATARNWKKYQFIYDYINLARRKDFTKRFRPF